jgi:vacuolar-type H+-ATPase subunit C/Vma6
MTRGARAYAHARIRACKSRLFTRADVLPLLTAADAAGTARALAALGIEAKTPMERLLRIYRTAIRGYPDRAPLFFAMLRLHEIENVKLVWRTIANDRGRDALRRLWLDLGSLASVPPGIADAATLRDLVERLAETPYAAIAARVAKAHADDLTAAELALDRWASQSLLEQGRGIAMIEKVVREREEQLNERAAAYGLTKAESRKQKAEVGVFLPSAFCLLPFSILPAIRVLLLAEAEVRGLTALVERAGDAAFDAAVERVLARGLMGA